MRQIFWWPYKDRVFRPSSATKKLDPMSVLYGGWISPTGKLPENWGWQEILPSGSQQHCARKFLEKPRNQLCPDSLKWTRCTSWQATKGAQKSSTGSVGMGEGIVSWEPGEEARWLEKSHRSSGWCKEMAMSWQGWYQMCGKWRSNRLSGNLCKWALSFSPMNTISIPGFRISAIFTAQFATARESMRETTMVMDIVRSMWTPLRAFGLCYAHGCAHIEEFLRRVCLFIWHFFSSYTIPRPEGWRCCPRFSAFWWVKFPWNTHFFHLWELSSAKTKNKKSHQWESGQEPI